ncbi:MAG: hypothetical protein QXQ46_08050 [Thermoplasmatales archaeon]
MTLVKEWRKKLIDRRNWREYNEQLVVREGSIWTYRSVMSGSWNLGR